MNQGSISFDLQRTGDIPAAEPETVFSLLDLAGIQVLRLQLSWTSAADSGNPRFLLRGPGNGEAYRRHGSGLWGSVIGLDRAVARGSWIHVDLTWDDQSRTYTVYVDGRAQAVQSGGDESGEPPQPGDAGEGRSRASSGRASPRSSTRGP